MDINVARYVIRASFRSGRELEAIFDLLRNHCGAEGYRTFAKAVATAVASIQVEVVNQITAGHPELEDEIDAVIAKYGRYL
jgi:hypothetical protein